MKLKLKTRAVSDTNHIRTFFDEIAENYQEAHGHSERLLAYRLSIIRQLLGSKRGKLLEIGCGTGNHLFQLAELFEFAIGTDLSLKMITLAVELRDKQPKNNSINFYTDQAEELSSIGDREIDTVLCVGAFEHMTNKIKVLRQVHRVLKPGGEFICLTPNGDYYWYKYFSQWLKFDTKHLSSDHFLSSDETVKLLVASGLLVNKTGYWSFIPKGDIPLLIYVILTLLDVIGLWLKLPACRGGFYFKAVKPYEQEYPIDGL